MVHVRVEVAHLRVIKTCGCLEQTVFWGLGDEKLPSSMGIFISGS